VTRLTRRCLLRSAALAALGPTAESAEGPAGYWPLRGDARDHSGRGHHAVNHGVDLDAAQFDGRSAYLEVPAAPALDPGAGDFALSAWIRTAGPVDGVLGDVAAKYDATRRRGFTLSLQSSAGGYNGQGTGRHMAFGIDDGKAGEWEDCGRPNATSNYVSNSLTVFDGSLYAATTDATTEAEWAHVYRYAGGETWEDCGRVGALRTRGVGPLIVHDGALFAANWTYDWTRVDKEPLDYGRVWRYGGGRNWEDCGQPGACRRLFGMASFHGRLYVVADDNRCHVWEGGLAWRPCGSFYSLVHPMLVHQGRLHVGAFGGTRGGSFRQAEVMAYDGNSWSSLGCPIQKPEREDQIHALAVYRGRLAATTWPTGKVGMHDGSRWVDCGRLGESTESNALAVYNGKLYAGSIPAAEVFRYEGGEMWTRIRRFAPLDAPESVSGRGIRWGRVTSLTSFGGRLFAGIGSYTSGLPDAPPDARGRVYAFEAGCTVAFDRDLGPGWRHIAAVRRGGTLELFVDGKLAARSRPFSSREYDLGSAEPLKIGFGEKNFFAGKIREVRFYRRAPAPQEIAREAARRPDGVERG
jgi:hypothetical protein